jgi:L-tyrosine isonitrile synthase
MPTAHLARRTSRENHAERPRGSARTRAFEILGMLSSYRRIARETTPCEKPFCSFCIAPHLDRVMMAVERDEPVVFVLPAFPAKSPNPNKVLGPRPDMAERQSITFLSDLCRRVGAVHAPGAQLILCSDGRVFSDAVGIKDSDITTYQNDLEALIDELGAATISTFDLDDVFTGISFGEMRAQLMALYGEPIEALQEAVRAGGEAQRLYCGITRFLLEDATRPDVTISRTALQKDCRRRAYEVIRRSKAWDAMLAAHFPNAVRLSIHPQVCGSRKMGIHLIETADEWLTPWHGVAVEVGGRVVLQKRRQAEALGAKLVFEKGRPSHYVLDEARPPAGTELP